MATTVTVQIKEGSILTLEMLMMNCDNENKKCCPLLSSRDPCASPAAKRFAASCDETDDKPLDIVYFGLDGEIFTSCSSSSSEEEKENQCAAKKRKIGRPAKPFDTTEDGMYQCMVCARMISGRRNDRPLYVDVNSLMTHAMRHTSIHQFACPLEQCHYGAHKASDITRHMMRNHAVKGGKASNQSTPDNDKIWKDSFRTCFPTLADRI